MDANARTVGLALFCGILAGSAMPSRAPGDEPRPSHLAARSSASARASVSTTIIEASTFPCDGIGRRITAEIVPSLNQGGSHLHSSAIVPPACSGRWAEPNVMMEVGPAGAARQTGSTLHVIVSPANARLIGDRTHTVEITYNFE